MRRIRSEESFFLHQGAEGGWELQSEKNSEAPSSPTSAVAASSPVAASLQGAPHLDSRSESQLKGNKLEAGLGTQSSATSTLENASTEPRASASAPLPSVESPPGPTIIQLENQVILPGQIGW